MVSYVEESALRKVVEHQQLLLMIMGMHIAGYAKSLQSLPGVLMAANVATWKITAAVVGCVGLVYAAVYMTQVESRLPLVFYRRKVQASLLCITSIQPSLEKPSPSKLGTCTKELSYRERGTTWRIHSSSDLHKLLPL